MVKVTSEKKALPMMRFERTSQEKSQDQVHRVRITLSSKNVRNLEKVCAELVNGAKDKRLAVTEDEVMPEDVSPIAERPSFDGGTYTPRSQYQHPSKKGCTNFRWSPAMSRFLLPFLIQQANFGLKMGRAFKREAFVAAAAAVTEKFRVRCNDGNVENHLRTVKTRYQQIRRLQSLNNTTWDEKEKKIIMSDKDYGQYIAANPKDEPFLNKPIEMYGEIVYICGDDPSHINFASEYVKENNEEALMAKENNDEDIIPKEDNDAGFITMDNKEGGHETAIVDDVNIMMDDEDVEIEEVGEATPSTPPPPPSRSPQVSTSSGSSGRTGQSGKKRKNHHFGDRINFLASQIGELAAAIRSNRRDITAELYSEVMKSEGYDEASLGKAFDYLNENENLARGFLVKSHNLRQAWLSEFFSGGAPASNDQIG